MQLRELLTRPPAPTIDLHAEDFDAACAQLAHRSAEFRPEVLVGIATGGVYVAQAMSPHYEQPPAVVEIALQRPSTKLKERVQIGRVLKHLPPRVANALRRYEVAVRERLVTPPPAGQGPQMDLLVDAAGLQAAMTGAERVLVVDDTVDSGRTLHAATEITRGVNASVQIRTAVITSTFADPPLRADYCLYERTLIRFHWSFDS